VDVHAGAVGEHEALLYSLARELLGSAAKHARAAHVSLRIAAERDGVRLTVADDGIGIAAGAMKLPGHFGLLTARHRVAAAGGELTVESAPGGGATIAVALPAQRSV
jgi:signal transduction histidine kinase